MHRHDIWDTADTGDWSDVADKIEVELLVKRRVDRVKRSDEKKRIAAATRLAARQRPRPDVEIAFGGEDSSWTPQSQSIAASSIGRQGLPPGDPAGTVLAVDIQAQIMSILIMLINIREVQVTATEKTS